MSPLISQIAGLSGKGYGELSYVYRAPGSPGTGGGGPGSGGGGSGGIPSGPGGPNPPGGASDRDFVIFHTDYTIPGYSNLNNYLSAVIKGEDADGNLYLVFASNPDESDIFKGYTVLAKYDPTTHTFIWQVYLYDGGMVPYDGFRYFGFLGTMTIDNNGDILYCISGDTKTLNKISGATGELLWSLSIYTNPTSVAVDSLNNIYLTQGGSPYIYVLNSSGVPIFGRTVVKYPYVYPTWTSSYDVVETFGPYSNTENYRNFVAGDYVYQVGAEFYQARANYDPGTGMYDSLTATPLSVSRYNKNTGEMLWAKEITDFNSFSSLWPHYAACDSDGSLYIVGLSVYKVFANQLYQTSLIKINSSGSIVWSASADVLTFPYPWYTATGAYAEFKCVHITNSAVYVSGFYANEDSTNEGYWFLKFSKSGSLLWSRIVNAIDSEGNSVYQGRIYVDKNDNIYFNFSNLEGGFGGSSPSGIVKLGNGEILSSTVAITPYDVDNPSRTLYITVDPPFSPPTVVNGFFSATSISIAQDPALSPEVLASQWDSISNPTTLTTDPSTSVMVYVHSI